MVLRANVIVSLAAALASCAETRDPSLDLNVRVRVNSTARNANELVVGADDAVFFDVTSSIKVCRRPQLAVVTGQRRAIEATHSLHYAIEMRPGEHLTATASISAMALFGVESQRGDVIVQLDCQSRAMASSAQIPIRYQFALADLNPRIAGFERIETDGEKPVYIYVPDASVIISADVPDDVKTSVSVQPTEREVSDSLGLPRTRNRRRWRVAVSQIPSNDVTFVLSVDDRPVAEWRARTSKSWIAQAATQGNLLRAVASVAEARQVLQNALDEGGWVRQAALLALSRSARSIDDPSALKALYIEMLINARELGSPSEEASSHRRLAFLATQRGEIVDAHRHLDASDEITKLWGDTTGQALTWRARGVLLLREQAVGAATRATKAFRLCQDAALSLGHRSLEALCATYQAASMAEHGSIRHALQVLNGVPRSERQSDHWKAIRVFIGYRSFEAGKLSAREIVTLGALIENTLSELTSSAEPSLRRFLVSAQVRVSLAQRNIEGARYALERLKRLPAASATLDSIPPTLLYAEVAMAAGRYSSVETILEPILKPIGNLTDDRLKALLLLAVAHERAGRVDGADRALARLDEDLETLFRRFKLPPARTRLLRRLRHSLVVRQRIRLDRGQPIRALEVGEQLRQLTLSAFVPAPRKLSNSRRRALRSLPTLMASNTAILVLEPYGRDLVAYFARGGRSWRVEVVETAQDAIRLLGVGFRRLYLTGHALADIDLTALLNTDGRPLAFDVELLRLPSILPVSSPVTPVDMHGTIAVGDPDGTLLHAAAESRVVAELVRGELLLGPRATRAAIFARLHAGTSLFHFAGHAEHLEGSPLSIRLRLYDGTIGLEDWMHLPATPTTVVLNACSSGPNVGPYAARLSEILLLRGSRFVLTTHRQVADEDSRRFMELFYRLDGRSAPTQAFRRASALADLRGIETWRSIQLWTNDLHDLAYAPRHLSRSFESPSPH